MYNPRFPHTLVVKRASTDANGDFVIDEEGNVTYETVELSIVSFAGDNPLFDSNGALITTTASSISFGYRNNTEKRVMRSGDVAVAEHRIATPMFTTPLYDGDLLELTDYERTYTGQVVRKITNNWGSNIWFNEVKN